MRDGTRDGEEAARCPRFGNTRIWLSGVGEEKSITLETQMTAEGERGSEEKIETDHFFLKLLMVQTIGNITCYLYQQSANIGILYMLFASKCNQDQLI